MQKLSSLSFASGGLPSCPGQGPAHRKTVNGAHQVQAQAPEEA